MKDLIYTNFSAIVPSYNEAKRFEKVISELLKIDELNELIFVDDGSTDGTATKVKKYFKDRRFIYLKHKTNKGKGVALKTGLKKAKNEVVLFLDADLENINKSKILKIVEPVLKDEIDLARGSFILARGRVTEIAVKPMMKILFPDLYFEQPISGQVCAKKTFLQKIDLESRWGVDIGILLDAIQMGQRIMEVNIGKLEHKGRTTQEKAEMAQEVLETMIKKAGLIQHKYKLIVFTLDNTLVKKNSIQQVFAKLNLDIKLSRITTQLEEGKITHSDFIKKSAELFRDVSTRQIQSIVEKIPLNKYASEVVHSLKIRKYKVAILSSNFSPIVKPIAEHLGMDVVESINLIEKDNIYIGKIDIESQHHWQNKNPEEAFRKAFLRITKKAQVKVEETIMVTNSERTIPLLKMAGLGVAFKPENSELKEAAEKTINVLAEILAIIE